MRFPALARTLRRIAEGGARAFYEGELAQPAWWQRCGTSAACIPRPTSPPPPPSSSSRSTPATATPWSTSARPTARASSSCRSSTSSSASTSTALGQDTAARLHLLAEAARLAFRDRDAGVGRPGARRAARGPAARQGLCARRWPSTSIPSGRMADAAAASARAAPGHGLPDGRRPRPQCGLVHQLDLRRLRLGPGLPRDRRAVPQPWPRLPARSGAPERRSRPASVRCTRSSRAWPSAAARPGAASA